jgi:acetyl esterase/lipase
MQILQKKPWKEFIHADTNIPKLREALLRYKQDASSPSSDGESWYVEEDIRVPVRDGTTIAVRIHKPKNPPVDGCPVFVVYHGGGFCLGGLDSEVVLCRSFVKLGGIAVNVDYRLAPEHAFPVPFLDAYDALKWVRTIFQFNVSTLSIGIDCIAFRRSRG